MSSVVISGNTSGTITLDAPAVAGTTTLTLPATSGTVVTKDTNGIISVNGVQFPATQSPSADANCLDDYEEGTFTPTAVSGLAGNFNFSNAVYTKIGDVVWFNFQINFTGTPSTLSNPVVSLPFSSLQNIFITPRFFEDGVGSYLGVSIIAASISQLSIFSTSASGSSVTANSLTTTIPFTWGANDFIQISGVYKT
jgi:hypothetical protein